MSREKTGVRIDKYLWAMRIFKTRSLASEACRKGRIIIGTVQVKPSRIISANEIVTVKKLPVVFTYQVIDPVENRVAAKLVPNYIRDLTPQDELIKLDTSRAKPFGYRPKGYGRPTKKERRTIDRLSDDLTIS